MSDVNKRKITDEDIEKIIHETNEELRKTFTNYDELSESTRRYLTYAYIKGFNKGRILQFNKNFNMYAGDDALSTLYSG